MFYLSSSKIRPVKFITYIGMPKFFTQNEDLNLSYVTPQIPSSQQTQNCQKIRD